MEKRLSKIIVIFFLFVEATKPVGATNVAGSSAMLSSNVLTVDPRIEQLRLFFKSYNSPLAVYATDFVKTADNHQIDWKLLPAITGVESSFGKQIPPGSYNAYGWNNGNYRFESWEKSIEHVAQCLREKYINQGLNSPYKMGPVYAPPSRTWASRVVHFMEKIDCFETKDCLNNLELTI